MKGIASLCLLLAVLCQINGQRGRGGRRGGNRILTDVDVGVDTLSILRGGRDIIGGGRDIFGGDRDILRRSGRDRIDGRGLDFGGGFPGGVLGPAGVGAGLPGRSVRFGRLGGMFGRQRRRGRGACRGVIRRGSCFRRRPFRRTCRSDVNCPMRRVCCFDGCERVCVRAGF